MREFSKVIEFEEPGTVKSNKNKNGIIEHRIVDKTEYLGNENAPTELLSNDYTKTELLEE